MTSPFPLANCTYMQFDDVFFSDHQVVWAGVFFDHSTILMHQDIKVHFLEEIGFPVYDYGSLNPRNDFEILLWFLLSYVEIMKNYSKIN